MGLYIVKLTGVLPKRVNGFELALAYGIACKTAMRRNEMPLHTRQQNCRFQVIRGHGTEIRNKISDKTEIILQRSCHLNGHMKGLDLDD